MGAVAADLFTGPYREQWAASLDAAIDVPGSIELVFDGGATDFSRWRVAIDGDHASVQVRCRTFIEQAQTVDGPRTRAEGVVDFDLTLARIDGAWFVASESLEFAPGSGP